MLLIIHASFWFSVMIATEDELRACKIPKDKWDFCAHTLLEVERCRADTFPFVWKCREEAHAASMCNFQEWVSLNFIKYTRIQYYAAIMHRINFFQLLVENERVRKGAQITSQKTPHRTGSSSSCRSIKLFSI